jgi:hypothetical protein
LVQAGELCYNFSMCESEVGRISTIVHSHPDPKNFLSSRIL